MDKPTALSHGQIEEIIASFASAARRAQKAGADGIQIHAAHGYLINEFLSPFFNRREDEWGGSPEKRFRLLKEIILACKQEVGEEYPILVKLNGNDYTPKEGMTPNLAAIYAAWLEELGIAALEVSAGTYFTFHMTRGEIPIPELSRGLPWWMRLPAKFVFKSQKDPCRFKPVFNLQAARTIKKALKKTPLILVGGVRQKQEMEALLAGAEADFLSLSRPFIREPFLIKKMQEGKTGEAACISCNKCLAAVFNHLPLKCYVNGLPEA